MDFFQKKRTPSAGPGDRSAKRRRRRKRSLWIAGLFMAFGLVVAIGERMRAPAPAAVPAEDETVSEARTDAAPEAGAARKPVLPATFRLGAGYAGGFIIGWLFRKFIKTALLVSGGLLALLAVARKLGWFEADWTSLEGYLRDSFAWIGGHAGSFKNFLTGYLPSAGAAALGFFFGVWSD